MFTEIVKLFLLVNFETFILSCCLLFLQRKLEIFLIVFVNSRTKELVLCFYKWPAAFWEVFSFLCICIYVVKINNLQ